MGGAEPVVEDEDACDLEHLRNEAAVALARNRIALRDLQAELTHHDGVSATMIDTLESGESLLDTFVAVKSSEIRPALTGAIRVFERTRHRARIRLTAVAYAEGASDEDIRQIWNMSREMVRRAKREIVEIGDEAEVPPVAVESPTRRLYRIPSAWPSRICTTR